MRLRSLIHLVEVALAVARPERIILLGSASLLPTHPELGEGRQPLETSYDSDLLMVPSDDEAAALVGEAIGQGSLFAKRHGYYADILRPAIVETLPAGWESRLHPVPGVEKTYALDPYDLALVKLIIGRQKDLDLLRALLKLSIIDPAQLRAHYQQTPLGEGDAVTAGRNLCFILEAMGAHGDRPAS
jgi:hypothetical protein